jgi:hypothetical protein
MAAAWSVWHGWYAQAKGLKKILKRMLNGKMSQAFERWWDAKCELIEMRVKIQRCLKKIMNRQLSGGAVQVKSVQVESNPVDLTRSLKAPGFNPQNLSSGNPVSKFAFKFNLYRYTSARGIAGWTWWKRCRRCAAS